MNVKKLLTQAVIACVAISGEALVTYFFNRRNEA
jgi:hypothetical protein